MSQSGQYFDTVLENVMHTDQQIRYAIVFDTEGNEIKTRVREGVEPSMFWLYMTN
jgi:hypothetical protein